MSSAAGALCSASCSPAASAITPPGFWLGRCWLSSLWAGPEALDELTGRCPSLAADWLLCRSLCTTNQEDTVYHCSIHQRLNLSCLSRTDRSGAGEPGPLYVRRRPSLG